jgi:hypothetical protein
MFLNDSTKWDMTAQGSAECRRPDGLSQRHLLCRRWALWIPKHIVRINLLFDLLQSREIGSPVCLGSVGHKRINVTRIGSVGKRVTGDDLIKSIEEVDLGLGDVS